MSILASLYEAVNKFSLYICKIANFLVMICLTLLVLDLGLGVISRYLFSYVPAWYEELAKIFLVWIAFAGGIIASDRGGHVSIHVFPKSTPAFIKNFLAVLVQIMILVTAFLVVVYGYRFAIAGRVGVFPTMDFLPLYVSYAAVPFGYFGIFIIALRNLLGIIIGIEKTQPK